VTEAERAFEEWYASNPDAGVRAAFLAAFEIARRPRVKPRKVPRDAYARILEARREGRTYVSIAAEYGISKSRVRAICVAQERLEPLARPATA
jgi:DNA invertase Pin-like site-specific DNA recombinase